MLPHAHTTPHQHTEQGVLTAYASDFVAPVLSGLRAGTGNNYTACLTTTSGAPIAVKEAVVNPGESGATAVRAVFMPGGTMMDEPGLTMKFYVDTETDKPVVEFIMGLTKGTSDTDKCRTAVVHMARKGACALACVVRGEEGAGIPYIHAYIHTHRSIQIHLNTPTYRHLRPLLGVRGDHGEGGARRRLPSPLHPELPVEYKHYRKGTVGTFTGEMANLVQSSRQLLRLPRTCHLCTLNERTRRN